MDDKKNKYVKPEAEIVEFNSDDIILTSADWGDGGNNNKEYWGS